MGNLLVIQVKLSLCSASSLLSQQGINTIHVSDIGMWAAEDTEFKNCLNPVKRYNLLIAFLIYRKAIASLITAQDN